MRPTQSPYALGAALCALFLTFSAQGPAQAQEPTQITGTVTDSSGEPLAAANVSIEEMQLGTTTDAEGMYRITVPATQALGQEVILRADLIGRQSESTTVMLQPGGTAVADFALGDDPLRVAGVTVTALGLERQARTLGISTQQVAGSELTRAEPNLVNTLSGKIAGVNITNSGPQGGSSRIVVRGENSITGQNQPLFVLDGIPIDNTIGGRDGTLTDQGGIDYGNPIQDINPDDIASLTVLKGPNAAALYGSRASNGAILIETKTGRDAIGGAEIVVSQQVTFEDELRFPNYQNQFGQGSRGQFSFYDGFGNGVYDDYDESYGPPLDEGLMIPQWFSEYDPATDSREPAPWVSQPDNVDRFFDVGATLTTNVSVAGSNETLNGRAAFNRMNVDGMVPGFTLERNSFSFAGGIQATDDLGINASAQYVSSDGEHRPGVGYGEENPMSQFIWFGRNVDVGLLEERYDEVRPEEDPIGGLPYSWNTSFHPNPYFLQLRNRNTDNRDRLIGQLSATYQLTDWLSAMARIGTDWYQDDRLKTYAYNPQIDYSGFYTTSPIDSGREFLTVNGGFGQWGIGHQETNTDFLLNANPDLGLPVTTSFTFGGNRREYERTNDYTWVGELAHPGTYDISNAAIPPDRETVIRRKRVNSLYGQAEFGYNDYAFLTVTGRNDWSSTLPEDSRSYFYPSVSGSFVFTDAIQGLQDGFLSYGKLRASWAEVGNDTDPYNLRDTFASDEIWEGIPSFSVSGQLANPELKPEITQSWEVGTELTFLDNRLGLDVTYYVEETRDQIMAVPLSRATGYASRLVNAGTVENRGVEVLLRGTLYQGEDFRWESTVTWAKNDGEVKRLAEGVDGLEMSLGDFWGVSLFAREGEPMGQLVGSAYQRDPDGNIIVSEAVGVPLWTTTPQVIGNVNPDWRGGWTNEFSYKGARLSFLLDIRRGGDIYSVTKMFGRYSGVLQETVEGRCTPTTSTPVPGYPACNEDTGIVFDGVNRIVEGADTTYVENTTVVDSESFWAYNFNVAENNLEKADYLKLREVTLSYALPSGWTERMRVSGIDVSLVGRNLFLWTPADHIDPETSMEGTNIQGFEYGQMPSTRSFGLNVTVRP